VLTVVAGNGISNADGDGGSAAAAGVLDPRSVAVDAAGNIWIGESVGHVRKVDAATGVITTVAGTNSSGYSGDGGLATNANLSNASGVALDSAGNLFIADTNNHRIRRVDAVTRIITTYAGNGTGTFGGDNGLATAASLNRPQKVSFDNAGNLLIADTNNHRIRRVAAGTGIITTVAGNGTGGFLDGVVATAAMLKSPSDMTVDSAGNLWIADTSNNRIRRVDAVTGIITAYMAGLSAPASVAIAGDVLMIGNTNAFKVLRVKLTGGCCTDVGNGSLGFSGEGIAATAASLRLPNGVAFDGVGNLYVADSMNNRIRKIAAGTGMITTIAGGSSSGFSGDNGPASAALLNSPLAVAVDDAGNVFIADQNNFRIRRINAATGTITTVAGSGAIGFGGDGGLATATAVRISQVTGIAVDRFGNLFLADRANQRIRKVDLATGIITTFAGIGSQGFTGDGSAATGARLSNPTDVAVDSLGNVFIADSGNSRIRRVDKNTQFISTVAGGGASTTEGVSATQASIDATAVKVDGQGNIYIAGSSRQRVQRVDALTQRISTLAGNGQFAFSGDDGPATSASLANPTGVAIDALGNVAIADNSNHRVRFVSRANNVPTISLGGNTTIDEGSLFTSIGSFADADANVWTGTVNYGDGSGTTTLALNSNKTFDLNHTYADNGNYTVSVAVDDGAGGRGTATVSVNVLNVTPKLNAGSNTSINEGGTFSQTGSFIDPGSDTWTGSVDYGDGSAVQSLALNVNKGFTLSHVYADNGTYPVTVWVGDDDSAVGQTTIQVAVNNLAPVITYIGSNGVSIDENDSITLHGTFTDAGARDSHNVTIKWGDGSADTSINLAAGEFGFSASHQYADDAPTATAFDVNTITVTVTDKDLGSATGNSSAKVMNVAPVISGVTGPTTAVALGTAATVQVNYTDKGPLDTHSCVFSWSDGQPNTTVTGGSGSCSATHSYAMPGTYIAGISVIDDDTGSAKSELTIQVNVTPTTSSLTAGGWILAPAGSFVNDPSLSGKANFGISVKYLKDSKVPTGQTEFDFKAGNLNLHSTNYDWLVITGNKAQYRGSATINGAGDYGFMVTAVDGDDAFRMVIWDKRTNAVIFDNAVGQPNPQLIGGGSVNIQSK
jgi:streptogramin lyase